VLHAKNFNISLIVGIIDIDDFKSVNDTYGHAEGDKVLVTIADILRDEIGNTSSSFFGRWGGEEFLFVLPNLSIDDAYDKLEKLRKTVEKTDFGEVGHKTISIGITSYAPDDTADDVFQRADVALYEAKETGKNKTCTFLES
jgi:diguanylate cyclase (GGDEF)-like protein